MKELNQSSRIAAISSNLQFCRPQFSHRDTVHTGGTDWHLRRLVALDAFHLSTTHILLCSCASFSIDAHVDRRTTCGKGGLSMNLLQFWEHTLQHFDYSSELGYDAEEQ